jgi:hypothetical protein
VTEYTATVYILPPSAATDSSLCYYDRDPDTTGQQFRLIFTPDMQAWPAFKLPTSNPGQFFYNVFYTGSGPASFTITLPGDFEFQGANPVHIYTAVSVVTAGGFACIVPDLETEIYVGDELNLTDVPVLNDFLYITVHLDYALKGTTGYSMNLDGAAVDPANGTTVLIPNYGDYTFSVSGAQNDVQTIQNFNEFKKIPGIGGLVMDGSNPVSGTAVELYGPGGTLLLTEFTDDDGWYMFEYKHKGASATYKVKLPGYGLVKFALLKANKFAEVNFDVAAP